jgi:lipopolysaccharide/colanic/teichoic acid biosynthesis glycosyltransferase
VLLALISLPLALPLAGFAGTLVALTLGRPILFRQRRSGLRERPFTLLKFRTMTTRVDSNGDLLPDERRLSAVGRLLRASSVDELPQFFNVLRGEMSFVGPRPLLARYSPCFLPLERRRFDALPGVTGWAQVNGRDCSSWDERLLDDAWYVQNASFALDLRILAMTLRRVLGACGVRPSESGAMPALDAVRNADSPTVLDRPL